MPLPEFGIKAKLELPDVLSQRPLVMPLPEFGIKAKRTQLVTAPFAANHAPAGIWNQGKAF